LPKTSSLENIYSRLPKYSKAALKLQ
jgi:hypothetical protein